MEHFIQSKLCLLVCLPLYMFLHAQVGVFPTWLDTSLRELCPILRAAAKETKCMERARNRAAQDALFKINEKLINKKTTITVAAFNEMERRLLEAGCWEQWPQVVNQAKSARIHRVLQKILEKVR